MLNFFAAIVLFFLSFSVFSCSVMFLNRESIKILGRNHDWDTDKGKIIVHKKGLEKETRLWGLPQNNSLKPVKWKSKYDNITFHSTVHKKNVFIPIGGINSSGLVICQLYVNDDNTTNLSFGNSETGLMASRWVEYCLDNYRDVNEIISKITQIKVINNYHAHWFAADKSGNCAVFEYINGNLVINYGQPLTFPGLTNHTYELSCSEFKKFNDNNGRVTPHGHKSIERFIRGISILNKYKNQPPLDYMFKLMHIIRRPANVDTPTKWTTIYDLNNKVIYYKTKDEKKYRKLIFDEIIKSTQKDRMTIVNIKA